MTDQRKVVELRKPSIRRDLNELFLYRNGQVEPQKFWSSIGYAIVAYWMVTMPARVWQDWIASIAIASALIAPDMVMKIIHLKTGIPATPLPPPSATVTTTLEMPAPSEKKVKK